MACRIEVALKPEFSDPAGEALLRKIISYLKIHSVSLVRVVDAYAIDEPLSDEEAKMAASEIFCDSVNQHYSINQPLCPASGFSCAIHVGFKPGVKDNVGGTAKGAIEELFGRRLPGAVYTSKQYLLSGKASKAEGEKVASELVANSLIERFEVKTSAEFGSEGFGTRLARVEATGGGLVKEIDLAVPDKRLLEISRQRLLALSLEEMRAIKQHYLSPDTASARKSAGMPPMPTDVELECMAQTWSEHCKHKIFNAKISLREGKKKKTINSLFKSCVKAATEKLARRKKWLVSVFSDNAGIIEFVPGWNIAMKVETHNSPSALDPYGGALTGILGVNRDVLGAGMGAKPIFNTDVFCFADPYYPGEIPPRLFHPRRVLEGVRAGVAMGGNASGIPTVNGALCFDERYLGKPLVYCGTGGLLPSEIAGRKSHQKSAMAGDRIFMVGGRIGKDGIHGATFSSQELHEGSPVSAVQLGDPYTQKKMLDFLLEARDCGLYSSIQDCGAGGLSSAVGEMAEACGGCILHLDRAPLKYLGLDPWEILVSESQERMVVSTLPSKAGEFASLARLRGVEVSDIGEFSQSGYMHVKYGAKTVAFIDVGFLHHGLPQMELEAELKVQKSAEPKGMESQNPSADLLALLSRPNICSKEYIIRQYDHEVQGSSVVKPLCGKEASGPSDAGVVRPLFERQEGIVVSNGLCPRLSDLDAYAMAANSVDEAVRNYVSAGGLLDRLALLDNFCWCDPIHSPSNPEGKHRLAQLVHANFALYDACVAYGAPLISGKDSMKNDYRHGKWRISIPPTLLVSAVGVIEDASLSMTSDFKAEGDAIYLLGKTKNELGCSEYYAMKGEKGANAPCVEFARNFALYRKVESAIRKRLISSCHDCSEGGIAVALSECCIGGCIGADARLGGKIAKGLTPTQLLFSESSGRFIVSVKKKDEARFRQLMRGVEFERIGEVKGVSLSISVNGAPLLAQAVSALSSAWKKTMDW